MALMSLKFLALVSVVFIVYYLFPKKYQWTVLLAASYFYYIFTCNKYVIYLAVTTVTTFIGALILQSVKEKADFKLKAHKEDWNKDERKAFKKKTTGRKKLILVSVLLLNFGILAFLKYFGFLAGSVMGLLNDLGLDAQLPRFKFLLPLGISFYTFQAMGYIIDVYRSKVKAEKNIAKFALFVSFFPQIIQGPIGFYSDLAHQLYEPHKFSYDKFKSGGLLILWGIFKKLVIADRAVKIIWLVAPHYEKFSGTMILTTALVYAVQLYADFSGGIDVCRGVAEILGIEMAENFRRPYFSKTLTEYWHRWHITLGAWLRTYLFYPMSISSVFLKFGKTLKKKTSKHIGKVLPTSIASLITFLVIGIWHGASWKYVAFGFWNGAAIMISALLQPFNDKLTEKLRINKENFFYKIFAMIRTFLLVLVGYYFDIATGFSAAIKMMWRSVTDFHISDYANLACLIPTKLDQYDYIIIGAGTLIILIVSIIEECTGKNLRETLSSKPVILQWPLYLLLICTIILFGVYGPGTCPSEFVYMQF